MATVEYQRVSVAELRSDLDAEVRAKLGVSVDEFLAQLKAQTLDMTSPLVSQLAVIGRLLLSATAKR